MVVFPALSSPLNEHEISAAGQYEHGHSQKKDAHLPLLPSVLANYCKQTHIADVLVVG